MTDIVNSNMNPAEGHIVAMGGGGFSMEPDNPLLEDFVLGLSPQAGPRLLCANGQRRFGDLHRAVLSSIRGAVYSDGSDIVEYDCTSASATAHVGSG